MNPSWNILFKTLKIQFKTMKQKEDKATLETEKY